MCVDDALGLVLEPSKAIPIPFLAWGESGQKGQLRCGPRQ